MVNYTEGSCAFQCAVPHNFQADGQYRDQLYRLSSEFSEATAVCCDRQDGVPFPFHSDRYRALFGGYGNEVMKEARRIGLIERADSWIVGEKAKLARLTDRYRDGHFRIVSLGSRPRAKKAPASLETLGEVRSWIVGHLARFTLPEAPKCRSAWDRYIAYRFASGQPMRASRCAYGRLHYVPTGMSRLLRAQLSTAPLTGTENGVNVQHIESKREAPFCLPLPSARALFQIDVKTCQPLLIGASAYNEWLHPKRDVYHWLELCQESDLYGYMAERVFGGVTEETRGAAKTEMMVANFGTEKQAMGTRVGRIIRSDFPTIWEYLTRLRKGDHRKVARFAQGLESKLIIDGVCGYLMRNYRDIPIATVHDAIICSRHFVAMIKEVIEAEFVRELGVVPKLEVKELSATVPDGQK